MRDRPLDPLEEAVWWTEYVIRHKGTLHLRSPLLDLNFLQKHNLDIVLILILLLLVAFTIICMLYQYIICKIKKKVKYE